MNIRIKSLIVRATGFIFIILLFVSNAFFIWIHNTKLLKMNWYPRSYRVVINRSLLISRSWIISFAGIQDGMIPTNMFRIHRIHTFQRIINQSFLDLTD